MVNSKNFIKNIFLIFFIILILQIENTRCLNFNDLFPYRLIINNYTIIIDNYTSTHQVTNILLNIHNLDFYNYDFRYVKYKQLNGLNFPYRSPLAHPHLNCILPIYENIHMNLPYTHNLNSKILNDYTLLNKKFDIEGVEDKNQHISQIFHFYNSNFYQVNYNPIEMSDNLKIKNMQKTIRKDSIDFYINLIKK